MINTTQNPRPKHHEKFETQPRQLDSRVEDPACRTVLSDRHFFVIRSGGIVGAEPEAADSCSCSQDLSGAMQQNFYRVYLDSLAPVELDKCRPTSAASASPDSSLGREGPGPLLPAKSEGADISAPKSEKEATMRRLLPPVPLFVLLLLGYMASAQSTSGFPKSLAC